MNAPDKAITLEAELVPLDSIVPSDTHIQQMRRKRFSDEGILELAASIQSSGVINPILVRVLGEGARAHRDTTAKYELVAGERRWLGAKRAGLAHIPCVIRDLDDGAVIEAQLVENLQRDNLNPLEEAEGYAELKELKGYDAAAIGTLIGKSKSYVYARMKLTDLCENGRKALEIGQIDTSKALLIARFSPQLQDKALEFLGECGPDISYRDAVQELRTDFLSDLKSAPFALDDHQLFRFVKRPGKKDVEDCESLPACVTCPHNSVNDSDLTRELGTAHVCTNRPCFELKIAAFWDRERKTAEANGRQVLDDHQAKRAIPQSWNGGYNDTFLDLDAESHAEFPEKEPKNEDSPEWEEWDKRRDEWRPPTWREVLGADAPAGILAKGSKGERHELVPVKDAAKLLKTKGIKIIVPGDHDHSSAATDEDRAANAAAQKRDEEKRKVESEYRKRLFREIHAKWKGPLKRADLERCATELDERYGVSEFDALEELYPESPNVTKLTDDELACYVALNLVADDCEVFRDDRPTKLLDLAQRFKIDAKKIRAEVVKELKPTSASTGPDETKPATPSKKKAAKK